MRFRKIAAAASLLAFSFLAIDGQAAEQSSYVIPESGPKSMGALVAENFNPALRAIASCHNGSSAPANGPSGAPLAYQCWVDTTSNPSLYKSYDGASWITLGSLNTSTHAWIPYLTGGTSGGVPYFPSTGVMASSAALSQYAPVIGGGAGAAPSTITAGTDDQVLFGRTSNSPLFRSVTGDVTFSGGVSAIGANKVTDAMIRQSGALALVGRSANSTGDVADIQASAASGCAFRESSSTIGCGTLATAAYAANSVTDAKLRQSGALSLVGRSANSTGDVADIQASAGSSCAFRESSNTIACGTLATAAYAANSVTNAKLAQMANATVKCRTTAGTGDPEDCNASQGRSVLGLGSAAEQNTGTSGANVPLLNGNNTSSGNNAHTGTEDFQAPVKLSAFVTSTQITGNQNDYTATDGGNTCTTKTTLRISSDASRSITGLSCGQAEGDVRILHNVGAQDILLTNQDSNSTEGNRFLFGGDTTLGADTSITIRYDGVAERWRAITTPGAGGGGGGVTSVTIAAGVGVAVSGTCTVTSAGTCTVAADPSYLRGYLSGLTVSNNATDATNDLDIAVGVATSSDETALIKLSSALTKRTDAIFTAGTGNGCWDTGSVADGTIHLFLIKDVSTPAVDVLCSASPTAPTLPGTYTVARRIASVLRASGAIRAFKQSGDIFKLASAVQDRSNTSVVTNILISLTVPTGIKVVHVGFLDVTLSTDGQLIELLSDGDQSTADTSVVRAALAGEVSVNLTNIFLTNTSGQLRFSLVNGSGTPSLARVYTIGWIDSRDR